MSIYIQQVQLNLVDYWFWMILALNLAEEIPMAEMEWRRAYSLEEMMERMLSNQSLTLLFRSTTAMTWIFQYVVEQSSGSRSTSNLVQSMLLKLE